MTSAKAKPRPHDGGAILVESLLVISMLVLVLIAMVFVYRSHSGQARLLRATRAAAMAYAANSCRGQPQQDLAEDEAAALSSPADQSAGEAPGRPPGDARAKQALDKAVSISGLGLPREASLRGSATVKMPVTVAGKGDFEAQLRAGSHVLCGEKDRGEGPLGILPIAFDFLLFK